MIFRAIRILAVIFLGLLALAVAAVTAVFMTLNTGAGRNFVAAKINHFAPGGVAVSGLGGHFPADIKLARLTVTDRNGIWLTGGNLELRWSPLDIFGHNIHITSLTAADLTVARAPIAASAQKKSTGGSLPDFHLAVDHLAIPSLTIGAALAGQNITLNAAGAAHLQNPTQGDAELTATAASGQGSYQLNAAIDAQNVNMTLHVAEPPDGLLGHFAGPQVHDPLHLDVTLNGPRDAAALSFTAALGAAKLNGAGTLGLNPEAPSADVVLTVPSLAPAAAIANQNIAGSTTLHLIAARKQGVATIALNGDVALTSAPGPAAKLVGPNGHLALLLTFADNRADIKNLTVTGAGFAIATSGTVAPSGIDLHTQLALNNAGMLSPGISGGVAETGTVAGSTKDFAIHAIITGNIAEKSLPTGPFNIVVNAQHLPQTPTGTVTAAGALENSPLSLNAAFTRDVTGAATLLIDNANWRSLQAQADLALPSGAKLPTGTAKISVTRLADFARFAPLPLAGSLSANFAHNAQNFTLTLAAKNLVVSPSLGPINATLNANGPTEALAVKLNATIAKLLNEPARLAANGAVNIDARSLSLAAFTASWRSLHAILQGPASIETKPNIVVHHLALGLNGGSISLDGTISPSLNLRAALKNLPVSLASLAAPTVNATGTISATANLTGSAAAPAGTLTLNANQIALHSGPAAAVPPANLAAAATLNGKSANLRARLNAGANLALNADGTIPLNQTGPINLHLTGTTDLRLLDPILAAAGTTLRGIITPDITVTGTPSAPAANGAITLADGSVQNIGSGLSLTKITAHIAAANRLITLTDLNATAGPGTLTGHGTADLGQPDLPIDIVINAANARPVSSDLITENLNAALTIKGALRDAVNIGALRDALSLAGRIDILNANINIPKSLPASVANLPIINRGEKPPPPPPPPPNMALNLLLHAHDQIFIRGDGLFAELGGRLTITGTAANPDPEGGFTLIRGYVSVGGKTLQFTKGVVSFNGAGFVPTLDLEASNTDGNVTATLVIGGTAAKPTITLTSSPPLPSDEILAHLLFGQGTQNLSAFQAAQLAAALASLAGIGGGASPLDSVRNALGLDQLSLGGSGTGAPSVQAGRYVAPGVYVGATQSTTGQGTQATVEINLYKGLKLTTSTGTSGSSGNGSSVGLTYQFNY